MAASIPEGTWIFIVILAVIILAILSNDSISRGSSSSRSSSSSGAGSSSDSTDRPPRINARHVGDQYIGGSFGVKGNFNLGSASDYDIEASLNGSSVGVDASNGSFATEDVNVREGENQYTVKIQTSIGEDSDSGSFPATNDNPDSSKNPKVRVTEQDFDPDTGKIRLKAEAEPRDTPETEIAFTGFVKLIYVERGTIFEFSTLEDSVNNGQASEGPQHLLEGSISPPDGNITVGTVQYQAKTKDKQGRTGTYEDGFSFERDISDGGSDSDGSGTSVDIDVDYGGSDSETGNSLEDPSGGEGDNSADGSSDGSDFGDEGPHSGDISEDNLSDDENDDNMSAADDLHGIDGDLQDELEDLKNAVDDVKEIEEGHEEEIELENQLVRQLNGLIGDLNKIYKDEQQIRNVISDDSMDLTSAMRRGDLNSTVSDLEDLVSDCHRRLSKIQDYVEQHDDYEHKVTNMDKKFNKLIKQASSHESEMEDFAEHLEMDLRS